MYFDETHVKYESKPQLEPFFRWIQLKAHYFTQCMVASARQNGVFGSCASIAHIVQKCSWFFYRLVCFFPCCFAVFCFRSATLSCVRGWMRSTKSHTDMCWMCAAWWTIAQEQWVSSSRIPLLFVSLASTVDHHNRLCIVFGNFLLRIFACVFINPRAYLSYCSVLKNFHSF